MTTTTISGATVRCRRASSSGSSCATAYREDTEMRIRHLAAAAALTIGATAPAAGATESRASRGMGRGDGPCMAVATPVERALLRLESNGWPTADNPRSTAFGCAQALLAIRRHYVRRWGSTNPSTTDVAVQMCIFRRYIADRYGTAERALRARRTKGWY